VVKVKSGRLQGSGVIVGDGRHVITNEHVITGASNAEMEISIAAEGQLPQVTGASIIYASESLDLALLRLDKVLGTPIKIARKLPSIGDALIIGGFPEVGGETVTITSGVAAGFEVEGFVIKVDASMFPGNSGGAAVDANGQLIGISKAVATDGGGALGFLLSTRLFAAGLTNALLNDLGPVELSEGRQYQLASVGIPGSIVIPSDWEMNSQMGYVDARSPGSDPAALSSEYTIFGAFRFDLLQEESPEAALNRLIKESAGAFELIARNDIELPPGFTETILVESTKTMNLSVFETRESVLGSWIATSGLMTRFAFGSVNGQPVMAFIEASSLDKSRIADVLLKRIQLGHN